MKSNLGDLSISASVMLAILACLLWSTAFAFVKIGLNHCDPFLFAGTRFMIAGLFLLPYWVDNISKEYFSWLNMKYVMIIGFYQIFVMYGLFYLGITKVSGAMAAIIIGASPVTSAILAHFFMYQDLLSLSRVISLCLGVVGIIVVSISRLPWLAVTGSQEMFGIVLLLLSTIASGIGNIMVAKDKYNLDPLFLNSMQMFFGGLLLFLVSLIWEGVPKIPQSVVFYGSLFWLSMISTVSFSIWFWLLKHSLLSVSQLNVWKFIIPVFGAIFSWIIHENESPKLDTIIGMSCIAFSIIIYNLRSISGCIQNRKE